MSSSPSLQTDKQVRKSALAAQLLLDSGHLFLRAIGRSMVPAIWPGDELMIEPAKGCSLTPGDLVVFSNASRFVAHRVVAKMGDADGGWVLTHGDAVVETDAPIRPSEILGKVSFIVRKGKCCAAKNSLRRSERVIAALLRHSKFAARAIVGVHGFVAPSAKPQ